MNLAQQKKKKKETNPTSNDVPLLHRGCATVFNQVKAEKLVFHIPGGVMPKENRECYIRQVDF